MFAVSSPLNKAGLKFEQIVRNRIHRIPPKVRSGIDGNDKRKGDHKSGAIAESEGLRSTRHSRRQGTIAEGIPYTYFYPATKSEADYQIAWPWPDEAQFRRRFLASYSGTALSYPQQSAATGMLREVEFITPMTLDTGEPVFLIGYVFEQEGCALEWRAACKRLQLGGERGYGWGQVELIEPIQPVSNDLFDGKATFIDMGDQPAISLPATESLPGHLLAHTIATDLPACGEVEPLVGREWRSYNSRNRYAGQHVEYNDVCFAPGSKVVEQFNFIVKMGMWRWVGSPES